MSRKLRRREDLDDEEDEEEDVFDEICSSSAENESESNEDSDEGEESENVEEHDKRLCAEVKEQKRKDESKEEEVKETQKEEKSQQLKSDHFCFIKEEAETGKKTKKEQHNKESFSRETYKSDAQRIREDPCYVPRSERYFLHDDRLDNDGLEEDIIDKEGDLMNEPNANSKLSNNKFCFNRDEPNEKDDLPRATQVRIGKALKLWSEGANHKWTHDKFFELIKDDEKSAVKDDICIYDKREFNRTWKRSEELGRRSNRNADQDYNNYYYKERGRIGDKRHYFQFRGVQRFVSIDNYAETKINANNRRKEDADKKNFLEKSNFSRISRPLVKYKYRLADKGKMNEVKLSEKGGEAVREDFIVSNAKNANESFKGDRLAANKFEKKRFGTRGASVAVLRKQLEKGRMERRDVAPEIQIPDRWPEISGNQYARDKLHKSNSHLVDQGYSIRNNRDCTHFNSSLNRNGNTSINNLKRFYKRTSNFSFN